MSDAQFSKLSGMSPDSALSSLDLFAVPATHTSVLRGTYSEVYPVDGLSKEGTLEFKVPGSHEMYMDLRNTYLEIAVRVLKADGSALDADADVVAIDNFFHSMFAKGTL